MPELIIFIIGSFIAISLSIHIISSNRRKELERQKAIRRHELERQNAEREQVRKEQEAERRKEEQRIRQLEEKRVILENHRNHTLSNFHLLPGSDCWPDDIFSEEEQIKRIDRVYYDTKKMSLECFDTRYNIAKIRGTSWRLYLTNAQFCTCPDFRFRLGPCKHMYFLGNWIADKGEQFIEIDYEKGLSGITAYLVGRFPKGKEQAVADLQERGCEILEKYNNEVNIAITGRTNAVKTLEKLQDSGVPIFDYKTALKVFSSEIRHPELEDETMSDQEVEDSTESTLNLP